MRIEGIEDLEIREKTFELKNSDYPYSGVTGISFIATITSHNVNGIPTGKTYDAKLTVHIGDTTLAIEPKRGWLGKLKAEGMEALQRANSLLSQLTFSYRVRPYEAQFDKAGFFEYASIQFHRDGHIFKNRVEVGSVRGGELEFRLAPFQLVIFRKTEGIGKKLAKAFINRDITLVFRT